MSLISLAIEGIGDDLSRLDRGGVYWGICSTELQATVLAASVLAGSSQVSRAVLAGIGFSPVAVTDCLLPEQGPRHIAVRASRRGNERAAWRGLATDLARVACWQSSDLCVVLGEAQSLVRMGNNGLERICRQLSDWAEDSGVTVLVVACGDTALLVSRLMARNVRSAGVCQLHAQSGQLFYSVLYWGNALGVIAGRQVTVSLSGTVLRALPDKSAVTVQAALALDHGDYLVQVSAMEGAPCFSSAWRQFDDPVRLMQAAQQARQATIVFSIEANSQSEALSRLIHQLRRTRGTGLKIVVREMAPCLRYADEHLLLRCGANGVVPSGIPLSRFLTLLKILQGQQWAGELPADVDVLLRAHRPPAVCGHIGVSAFRDHVLKQFADGITSVESALLTLQPVAGVSVSNVLSQMKVRRQGDFYCVQGRSIHLFLFACRVDAVEAALSNLFRVSWRELFDGYMPLAVMDVAGLEVTVGNDLLWNGRGAEGVDSGDTLPLPLPRQWQPRKVHLGETT